MSGTEPKLCPIGEALYEKLYATDAGADELMTYQDHITGCEKCKEILGFDLVLINDEKEIL